MYILLFSKNTICVCNSIIQLTYHANSIVMYTCLHYFSQMSFFIKFINIKVKAIQFLNRHTQFYQYFKIFLSYDAIHIINWNLRSIKWLSFDKQFIYKELFLTRFCYVKVFVNLLYSKWLQGFHVSHGLDLIPPKVWLVFL